MKIAACLLAVAVASAPVWAEPAQVFPLTGIDLPPARRGTTERLTQAIADAMEAELSSVPLEDAAGLLDCDVEATSCLEAVSKKVGNKELVFGTVAKGPGTTLKVTLTRFRPGPDRQQRTYELTGETEALSDELVRKAAPLLGTRSLPAVAPPKDPTPEPAPEPPREPDAPSRLRKLTPTTWALLGGGLVLTGIGIGVEASVSGLNEQIAAAPRETRDDFDRLVALEDTARTRSRVGAVLLVGGGAALVAGGVLAYLQLRSDEKPDDRAVAIVPITGGGAVTVTWGLR